MARSTKLDRVVTDALNTRLTTAEEKVVTIESLDLVELGDNISGLNNDANYQNATQVDARITAVVGAAPAALDTLGEIAAKLADDDDAVAAIIAVNTAQSAAITDLEVSISELNGTDISLAHIPVSFALNTGENQILPNVENFIAQIDVLLANVQEYLNAAIPNLNNNIEGVRSIGMNASRHSQIRRLTFNGDISLSNNDAAKQHLISTTSTNLNILLPSDPRDNQEFELINNAASTSSFIFAGEIVAPGTRHAVQWDGVEWVVM